MWGYRNYLGGLMDMLCFMIYLILIVVFGGLHRFGFHFGLLKRNPALSGILHLCILISILVWALHLMFRDLRRRYDWAQLWQKVTANVSNVEKDE